MIKTVKELADKLWRVHPKEIQDAGITRIEWYEREIQSFIDENNSLELAIKIIEARIPLYNDISQVNALKECVSCLKGKLQ